MERTNERERTVVKPYRKRDTFKALVPEGDQHMNVILWNKKADRNKRGDKSTEVGKGGEVSETGNVRERKTDPRG